jgi:hypothetical protein
MLANNIQDNLPLRRAFLTRRTRSCHNGYLIERRGGTIFAS